MRAGQLTTTLSGLILAAIAPLCATAQSVPNVAITGAVELEYLTSDDFHDTMLFGDVGLSFGPASGATGLGFDLGLLAIDGDSFDTETALFAAATYTTSYGKFSFGVPRNAASAFSRMPDIGGMKLISIEQDAFTGGIVELLYLFGDEAPVGLRYDADYGMLKTAISYHHLSDVDADIFDLALSYDTGRFFANGSLENVKASETSSQSALHAEIGASADFYEAGLGYTSGSNVVPDAFMAWATYRPMEQLDLTATVFDVDGSDSLYGLSGKYGFWKGAYVQAGMVDSSSADALWDLSLGYQF